MMTISEPNYKLFNRLLKRIRRYLKVRQFNLGLRVLLFINVTLHTFLAIASPLGVTNYFDIKDGLSQITVSDIAQDKNGYIWLATQVGVDRFDGHAFKNYDQFRDPKDPRNGNFVGVLKVHPETGDLWKGTFSGVSVIDANTNEEKNIPIQTPSGNSSTFVQDLFIDTSKDIWISTIDSLYLFSDKTQSFEHVMNPKYTELETISRIAEGPGSSIIAITNAGIFVIDKETMMWSSPMFADLGATIVLIDSKSRMWIGTASKGLFISSLEDAGQGILPININKINGLLSDTVSDILESKNGAIWLATHDGVGVIQNPGQDLVNVVMLDDRSGPSNEAWTVMTIFEAQSGHIFFGSVSNGFGILDPHSFLFENLRFSDSVMTLDSAREDEQTMWVASSDGLFKIDSSMSSTGPYSDVYEQGDEAAKNKILSLHYSHTHRKLYAASRLGLLSFNTETNRFVLEGFEGKSMYSIAESADGNLWLGFRTEGLTKYDPVTKTVLKRWDMPFVTHIYTDNKEDVFVGTAAGLFVFQGGSLSPIVFKHDPKDPTSIKHDVVTFITELDSGDFAIGLQGNGISLMRKSALIDTYDFIPILQNEKLSSLSIGAIVQDDFGDLWVSTNSGMTKISDDLEKIEYFSGKDGAQDTGYFVGGSMVDSDGTIFFSGSKGVTYFNPENVNKQKNQSPLHITNITTLRGTGEGDDKTILANIVSPLLTLNNYGQLPLPADNLTLDIAFSALEFSDPKSVMYRYKLEGFDKQWRSANSLNRIATYTNLDPGEYTFKLKASDRFGEWDDSEVHLAIYVETPWWQTLPFMLLWALVLLASLYLIYMWRISVLKNNALQLKRLVKEKTHSLEQAVDELKRLSSHDFLTGILNRRGFLEAVERAQSSFERNNDAFAIALIDVDFFKKINDKYGHEAGDYVLISLSQMLRDSLRKHDLVARWGGEEFILLLADTSIDVAIIILNRIRNDISQHEFIFKDTKIKVTFSCGVQVIEKGKVLDEVINQADANLYQAKQTGRNKVI